MLCDHSFKYSGPVNVLGSGRGVWDDLAKSPFQNAPTIAVNVAGIFAPRLIHWASVHREFFPAAIPLRKLTLAQDYNNELDKREVFTHAWNPDNRESCVDFNWSGDVVPDTSGCFAVMLAIEFGFSPIVMCGIPLDDSGRFHAPYCENRKDAYRVTNDTWAWLRETYGDKVRSMSGLTMEWFGKP